MPHLPRVIRVALAATALILLPTLYILYPSSHSDYRPPSPSDPIRVDAGGIDSDHWRDPIVPDPAYGGEQDISHALDSDNDGGWEKEEVRQWGEEFVVGGGRGGVEGEMMKHGVDPVASGYDADQSHSENKGTSAAGGGERLGDGVIMPKLGNATAKAELGRAAWKVLHLMTLRYPETPTPDERSALKSYFHLFARLYPCGECAAEFTKLLKEYPPQTSSRKSASLWLCHVHNLVNARLGKPEFDCLTLDETYDCGCGPEGALNGTSTSNSAPPTSTTASTPTATEKSFAWLTLFDEKAQEERDTEEAKCSDDSDSCSPAGEPEDKRYVYPGGKVAAVQD